MPVGLPTKVTPVPKKNIVNYAGSVAAGLTSTPAMQTTAPQNVIQNVQNLPQMSVDPSMQSSLSTPPMTPMQSTQTPAPNPNAPQQTTPTIPSSPITPIQSTTPPVTPSPQKAVKAEEVQVPITSAEDMIPYMQTNQNFNV